MAYIYKKTIGEKDYYYLRVSSRKGQEILTKDIAYLGNTLEEVRENLKKISPQITRKAYKTLQRFLQSNIYLELAKKLKLKTTPYINKTLLEQVEACRIHWNKVFQKLDKKTQQDYIKNFAIEFTFNTTGIEGNTITLKEADLLLREQLTPKNKELREVYDVKNTENTLLQIIEKIPELNHENIINLHKELMSNIDFRVGYRTGDVHVFHARFSSTPAPYVKTDMAILLKWYEQNKNKIHPLALAGIFHHKFEKIHPFFDGNGRIGRLLLNIILLKNNYPPVIVHKKKRAEYLSALSRADKEKDLNKANPDNYSKLIEFLTKESTKTYWNLFL